MLEIKFVKAFGVFGMWSVKDTDTDAAPRTYAAVFESKADAELFLRAKEDVAAHDAEAAEITDNMRNAGAYDKASKMVYGGIKGGLPLDDIPDPILALGMRFGATHAGLTLNDLGGCDDLPSPAAIPLRISLQLNADGSVDLHDYEILDEWCKRKGKTLEIKLTDDMPAPDAILGVKDADK